ncbi:RNA polymerase sigma factor [Membranihabitans marinus]|uniref:RNA polymerase sigma factor n=1 Tax=Membranihabitans marinus TaxID=1227546 RepID=UPI001F2BD27E|nr:sigma-70 family RNA polymerase sigma factor [Membranihabitans marinus]
MQIDTLEKLFIEHRDAMLVYLKVHVKSHDLAEDLLQDIYLKIYVSNKTALDIDQPASYLFSIARNMVIDYWRKVAVDKRVQEEFWNNMEKERTIQEFPFLQHDKNILLNEINQILTDQQKIIFSLNRNDGFSYNEIAEQLHLSRSTVKNHMVSALKKIRTHMLENKLYPAILIFLSSLL